MFDLCSTALFGSSCDFIHRTQDFVSWFDQRINVNEGLIALIAIIVGLGIQREQGRWSVWARRGLIAVAFVLLFISTFEPSYRPMWGLAPFYVEVPSLFRNSRGTETSKIAWDNAEANSVQLSSGELRAGIKPAAYLGARCQTLCGTDLKLRQNLDEIEAGGIRIMAFAPPGPDADRNACSVVWEDTTQHIMHYEIYLVAPSPDRSSERWAHLQTRLKVPTNVLAPGDIRHMADTFAGSANVRIPRPQRCR